MLLLQLQHSNYNIWASIVGPHNIPIFYSTLLQPTALPFTTSY